MLWTAGLAVMGALVVWGGRASVEVYGLGWCSLAAIVPILTGAVVIYLWKRRATLDTKRQEQLALLICTSALCSIVQFPFGAPGYFFYVAPLVILTAAAFFESIPNAPRLALAALGAFCLLFVLIDVTPAKLGLQREESAQLRELALPRGGGLHVESGVAGAYEETIRLVAAHAKGPFAYAAPDCPEIYFLAGLKSPSRHYFGFAEDEMDQGPGVVRKLEALGITVVAINRDPLFSPMMSRELEGELEKRFPNSADTEKFTVRWKD